jgi:hypothetical protein
MSDSSSAALRAQHKRKCSILQWNGGPHPHVMSVTGNGEREAVIEE